MRSKVFSAFLSVALACSLTPTVAYAATDTEGHWAESTLAEWQDYGVIQGYADGTIRPDASITRGEMATVLDRVMGYQVEAENTFTDLEGEWSEDAMLRAVAAGAFHGDDEGDTTIRPNDPISRQEAVLVLSRVLALETENAEDAGFADDAAIADWAADAVDAMVADGYIHGYEADNTFRPTANITRAEVMTILDNAFATLYQEAGEYTGDVEGSAVIESDGVTLHDATISGDLIIAEGVADGHVELNNVTVEGRLIVRGGGENSVIITGASRIGQIIVDRLAGAVRVAVEGAAEVGAVEVAQASDGLRLEGTIGSLTVKGAASVVEVAGEVDDVDVQETAENATVTILEDSVAGDITSNAKTATIVIGGIAATVTVSGDDNALTISGSVTAVDVAGDNAAIKLEGSATIETVKTSAADTTVSVGSNATVEEVTTSGAGTVVEGQGTVESVVADEGSSNVTVKTEATDVENNGSGNVTIEDGVIAPGESDTTPGGATTPGGGTGTVTPPPAHTHTYVDGICAADGAYDPTWAQVDTLEEWNAAVEAGKSIVVVNDFTTTSQLRIDRSITVNGNGKTITAADNWTGSSNDDKHLLLIVDEAGTESANGVVVKNLILNSAGKAYGAQAYCVDDAVFEDVTLQNSKGAGLTVNSSSVTAKGLTTSGNAWGGVNADNNVTSETTEFTFDAACVFDENIKVYSDNGGVTVNAPEGWAETTVTNGSGEVCVWAKLFAGGYGTEESPYLIATGEQLSAVSGLTDSNTHFKLTADIDMDNVANSAEDTYGDKGDVYGLYGILDGDGHTIISTDDQNGIAGVILYATGATISNVTFKIKNRPAVTNAQNTTFNSVRVEGEFEASNNNGSFVTYAVPGADHQVSLTFNNCTAAVDMWAGGAATNYNAVFVGYAYGQYELADKTKQPNKTTLTFNNCVNEGSLVCGRAAMFLGNNSANGGEVTINVINCVNKGLIKSIYASGSGAPAATYTWNNFIATGSHANNAVVLDGQKLESAEKGAVECENGGKFTNDPDSALALSLNENLTFTVTPAAITGVDHYIVTMSLYGKLVNADGTLQGGTKVVSVSDIVKPNDDGDVLTTTMRKLPLVDGSWVDTNEDAATVTCEDKGESDERTVYILNDQSYYYFGPWKETSALLENNQPKEPTVFTVTAYDAGGRPLCAASLA